MCVICKQLHRNPCKNTYWKRVSDTLETPPAHICFLKNTFFNELAPFDSDWVSAYVSVSVFYATGILKNMTEGSYRGPPAIWGGRQICCRCCVDVRLLVITLQTRFEIMLFGSKVMIMTIYPVAICRLCFMITLKSEHFVSWTLYKSICYLTERIWLISGIRHPHDPNRVDIWQLVGCHSLARWRRSFSSQSTGNIIGIIHNGCMMKHKSNTLSKTLCNGFNMLMSPVLIHFYSCTFTHLCIKSGIV